MSKMLDWVRLPTAWIRSDQGLKHFKWEKGRGADAIAALMILIVLAQHADQATGVCTMTYEGIANATSLSRAKISNGIAMLLHEGLIITTGVRSTFRLANFDPAGGWAKLPAKPLYDDERFPAFFDFRLRKAAELHALKLYLLFAAFRDKATNKAQIGYDKIVNYTGIEKGHIRPALTILGAQGLVHVEYEVSSFGSFGVASSYRLAKLESYRHNGTTGRQALQAPLGNSKIL